ncbi:hypothetical protein BH09BAC3_BH09BAC3_31870 [soil metagenome]
MIIGADVSFNGRGAFDNPHFSMDYWQLNYEAYFRADLTRITSCF